jgi:hypothetical protein
MNLPLLCGLSIELTLLYYNTLTTSEPRLLTTIYTVPPPPALANFRTKDQMMMWWYVVGSLKMNTTLEYSTRVVQEGDRRCKKSTLNDLAYLTPLRIPLMNPVMFFFRTARLILGLLLLWAGVSSLRVLCPARKELQSDINTEFRKQKSHVDAQVY